MSSTLDQGVNLNKTIKISVDNNLPLLLVGKHGTGKSFSIAMEAERSKTKLHRIIITQETTPEDLVCQYELKDGQTNIVKHDLLNAVEKGEWVCFEEINMGSPAVLTLLNGLLETSPKSRYIRFQDIEVSPHKDFRMFATANPTSYSGANRMNDALLSRFLVQLVQPDYKTFLEIIKKEFGENTAFEDTKRFLSALLKVEKNYQIYISPRELLVYAQLRNNKLSHSEAVGLIVGRHYDLDQDELEDVMALFQTEISREKVHVINDIELNKKIDEGIQKASKELESYKKKLTTTIKYKDKYQQMKKTLKSIQTDDAEDSDEPVSYIDGALAGTDSAVSMSSLLA